MMFLFRIGTIICWILGVSAVYVLFPMLFSKDLISFFLFGILGGHVAMFLFTIIFTYIHAKIAVRQEGDISEIYSDPNRTLTLSTQLWLGINFAFLPEFLSELFGAAIGLLVHIWLGWKWIGTLSVCILVGAISEIVLQFVLMILASAIAGKTTEN